jgi:hypothetical protein
MLPTHFCLNKAFFGRADNTATARKLCACWGDLFRSGTFFGTLTINRLIGLIDLSMSFCHLSDVTG